MIVTWDQIIALLPVLIIGITIIVIMLSIAYSRNQFRHAVLAVFGLILSGISAINILCLNYNKYSFGQLIYIDNCSAFYTTLILIATLASSISVYTWLLNYPTDRRDEFYVLLLLSSMGGLLLTMTNHLGILFLGIELISLPLFGLIGYSVFQKKSIESSIKYVILSGVSSSFLLFGIALIYAKTGCLSFIGIKEVLLNCNNFEDDFSQSMLLAMVGLTMIMVGFAFKLSFVPFHLWTPDIYQGSSSIVSMYLATGSKVAIISVLIRFLLMLPDQYYKIFFVFLSGLACCSMLCGSIMAVQQHHIKRILAYSSITNSGYLLIALISLHINFNMTQEAIGIYLISYLFSNIGVFGIINIISNCCVEKKPHTLLLYQGLFWRAPVLSIIFTIILLSLAGIPMTLGFIGKFYLLLMGISSQLWLLITFMVISSIISIFYYLRIITNLYMFVKHNDIITDNNINYNKINNWLCSPVGIIVTVSFVILLAFGLYPQPIISLTCLFFKC